MAAHSCSCNSSVLIWNCLYALVLVALLSMFASELGRGSPSKGPATPARTPVHQAYPDGVAAMDADIEAGANPDSGYGNLTPGPGDKGGAAAVAAEALEVIGTVGAKVSSLASARASRLAPPWVVRLRPGAKAGCQTTYMILLHLFALRCAF